MNNMKILPDSLLNYIRQSELRLAKSILRWKLQKEGSPQPNNSDLDAAASRLLDEAREIAKQRGMNLLDILKEEARRLFNKRSP
ncbi:MAG: hypothetical protein JSU80_11765 [Deltaproteobacteria bacterium]|nr:MAG: hypothetical protein JSU80_11765 [Deltaproteobacteria bacterium]